MKTVIEMAEEAGCSPFVHECTVAHVSDLERFAELVRADEREACAKLVDPSEEHRRDASWGYLGGTEGIDLLDSIAVDIRARNSK